MFAGKPEEAYPRSRKSDSRRKEGGAVVREAGGDVLSLFLHYGLDAIEAGDDISNSQVFCSLQ